MNSMSFYLILLVAGSDGVTGSNLFVQYILRFHSLFSFFKEL